MSGIKYEVLDCNFDWSNIDDYAGYTLAVRCDFSPDSSNSTAIPATGLILPLGITLQFEGGSFSEVEITGTDTKIIAPLTKIFDTSVTLSGTFVYDTFYPEWYGAVGDGITNDFAAMKATFEFSNHVTLRQKYLVYVPIPSSGPSPEIIITGDDFTLLGYGSLITDTKFYDPGVDPLIMSYPIFTFKNIKNLVIEGVTIDGNERMSKGITLDNVAKAALRDITVNNLQNKLSGRNSIGLEIFVIDGSKIHGDNIRISEIGGGQNNTIDEGVGIGRAIYISLDNDIVGLTEEVIKAVTQKTKITFDNSFFEWVYGDDGDVIDIIDENYISDALHRFIFTNCTIRYASRRLVKGSASGIQYYNCKFDTASESELRAKMGGGSSLLIQPSGGVNFRNANPSSTLGSVFRNMHGKMINCEYRNSGNLDIGSGHTLIAAYTNGVEIRGNQFYDSYVEFKNKTSNFIIDNNQFYNSNIYTNLTQDTLNEWEEGRSYITNNYGHYAPAINIHSALIDVKNDLISVTIHNNKVFSEEGGVNVGFYGLLRHTRISGTSNPIVAVDVNISNNEIIRRNSIRNEYLIVDDTVEMNLSWKVRCSLFDNFFNRVGPVGVGARFNSGTMPPSFYWNNRDGEGNVIEII